MDGPGDRRSPPIALDASRPYKPLDVGNAIVAGCVGPDGRILEAGIAHPRHGRVIVTSLPPFDESARFDAAAVRRFRAALASRERAGFGFTLPGDTDLVGGSIPRFRSASAELTVFAPAGRRGIVQLARGRVEPPGAGPSWELQRAAYTQLTEGGPLPPAAPGDLGAAASVMVNGAYAVAFGATQDDADREAQALAGDATTLLERELELRRGIPRDITWLLDCVACDVGEGTVALLADHQILPLVWTRDGYYVARALLQSGHPRALAAVAGFLRWCFERAERPDGWWPRSSLATGQAKDHAFQLDQQLYPPLLLAEHAEITGDQALLARHGADAGRVLDALLARADGGLVGTAETPADDPLDLPFHFSSHVLLWRTLAAYGRETEPLRARIRERFTQDGRFAYAVGSAGARHYHDANDLPTAFAPAWGFCRADDAVWLATVAHAWSERNAAYFAGRLGGLGSLHTRHPWPLGDLQHVLIARARSDASTEAAAWRRLERVETWDGLLPEAYDERDGSVASRHWFAWPVAVRSLLLAER